MKDYSVVDGFTGAIATVQPAPTPSSKRRSGQRRWKNSNKAFDRLLSRKGPRQ